jgi:hypothetical protein
MLDFTISFGVLLERGRVRGRVYCQAEGCVLSNPSRAAAAPASVALLLLLAMTDEGAAATPARADDELVTRCQDELEARLFSGGTKGEAFVTGKDIRHEAERVFVRLELASGEGRRIAGTCIFRDGKLFDLKP